MAFEAFLYSFCEIGNLFTTPNSFISLMVSVLTVLSKE